MPSDRRTHVSLLDQDLLTVLTARQDALDVMIGEAVTYRQLLRDAITRLRIGTDPATIRQAIESLGPILRRLKQAGRHL